MAAAGLLYLTNSSRLRDPIFQNLVRESRHFPGFSSAWDAVMRQPPSLYETGVTMHVQTAFSDQPIEEMLTLIPLSAGLDVSIIVSIPTNDAARHVYPLIGCEIDGVR